MLRARSACKHVTSVTAIQERVTAFQAMNANQVARRAGSQDDGKLEDQGVNLLFLTERQCHQSRSVKWTTHKLKSFSTFRIIAPDSNGNWAEQTLKEDVEASSTWENSRRFSQTSLNPFVMSPLIDDFGHLALGPANSAALDSSCAHPPGTGTRAQRKLFSKLRIDPAVATAPPMNAASSVDQRTCCS